ncbi:MAG TPA: hypothetical protein VFX61_03750 [Micromonosporaceae bacterium]|nr:hypothetical protein [Micromonosporaceae bacterium]
MSDWNGWPEDDLGFGGDGADPSDGDDAGYSQEGFGPADDGWHEDELTGRAGFGEADDVDTPSPIGYGLDPHVDDPLQAGADLDDGLEAAGPQEGFGPAEAPVGADPDLADPVMDGAWSEPVFPEMLELGELPEPVDGLPWIDPGLLGGLGATLPDLSASPTTVPDPAELAGYAGGDLPDGVDPWSVLADSPDPATSSLARWWSPGTGE